MRGVKHVGRFRDGLFSDEVLEDELVYLRRRRSARARRRANQVDLVDSAPRPRYRRRGQRTDQVAQVRKPLVNDRQKLSGGRE